MQNSESYDEDLDFLKLMMKIPRPRLLVTFRRLASCFAYIFDFMYLLNSELVRTVSSCNVLSIHVLKLKN